MTEDFDWAGRLKADRAARGLSRAKYAEMIGLTPTKLHNLEHGRKPKPEELPLLQFLAFSTDAPASSEGAGGAAPTSSQATDPAPSGIFERDKQHLVDAYRKVYERLNGRPAPANIPYRQEWGAPHEITDPTTQQKVHRWVVEIDAWLDTIDGPATPDPAPEPEATVIQFPTAPVEDEDEDEDEEALALAEVSPPEPWVLPDDGIRRFSNGEMRAFKQCRRQWWLGYYRKLGLPVTKVTGAANLGTRVHRALSVYYVPSGQTPGNPFEELDRTYQEDLAVIGSDEFAVADLQKEVDLARAMLEGYFDWLAETGADQGLEIIAPETKLEVDANVDGPEARLIAKLDVRARRTFGQDVATVFIDHKTVGNLKDPLKMLAFDEQMLHYHLCEYLNLLESGDDPSNRTDGAIYNMLRKVKRTASANPPFYDRAEVRHNIETLRSYWMRVKGVIEDIRRLEQQLDAGADPRQVAYPNPTRDCSWKCDFYHVCTMFDDGSRAEDFVSSQLVTINPLERYEPQNLGGTM